MRTIHITEATKVSFYFADEFAVQTCFLGRYGDETGSDQFGAMIMATRGDNSTSSTQRIVVRLSNIEVWTCLLTLAPESLSFSCVDFQRGPSVPP